MSLAISDDGKFALSGHVDPVATLWDLQSGQVLNEFTRDVGRVFAVALSPGCKLAATAADDSIVRIWDVATGKELRAIPIPNTGRQYGLKFGPDGKSLLVVDVEGNLHILDFGSIDESVHLQSSLPAAIQTLATHPNDALALSVLGNWYSFRGADDWAVQVLEQARAAGADVSSLTLARAYWKLHRNSEAHREFELAASQKLAPEAYLHFCLKAVDHPPSTQPGTR